MTLDKFIQFLEKNNINELSRADRFDGFTGIKYRREQWVCNYFDGINICHAGILIEFNYTSDAGNIPELKKAERMIKKYATRYNFSIFHEGQNLHGFYFAIMPADDRNELKTIDYFSELCISEIDLLLHFYHVNGIYETLKEQRNEACREISNIWKNRYLNYTKDQKTETNNILRFVA